MRALIRSTTGRPFRRAGLEFPSNGVEVDLDALDDDVRAAITGESRLVITPIDAPESRLVITPIDAPDGLDEFDELDEPPAPDVGAEAAAPRKKVKRA
jgi:hypothetical protein